MFIDSRKNLRTNVELIQRRLCTYDGFSTENPTIKKPSFCDCKYGAAWYGEQTGCPELRCILLLLENMTDEEFYEIVNRKSKHFLTGSIVDEEETAS